MVGNVTPQTASAGGGGLLRSRRYKVAVKTSDIRGAGTDANVSMTMFGEGPDGQKTKSADMKLENSNNNFERCMVRKCGVCGL